MGGVGVLHFFFWEGTFMQPLVFSCAFGHLVAALVGLGVALGEAIC